MNIFKVIPWTYWTGFSQNSSQLSEVFTYSAKSKRTEILHSSRNDNVRKTSNIVQIGLSIVY